MTATEVDERPSISVLTATYECGAQLPTLIDSLRRQSDSAFQWVVADGGSKDGTLDLLRNCKDIDVIVSSQPDFGIYDALNRALVLATGEYYVVAGADDRFDDRAIENFRRAIRHSGSDVIVADVMHGKHRFKIKRGPAWLFGEKSYIAHHSVGTAFRRELHTRFGLYSRKLSLGADGLFVMRACGGGATRHEADFMAGCTGASGASALDWAGAATDLFRAQLLMDRSVAVQTLLLLMRILKGSSSNARRLHNTLFRKD